MRHCAGREKNVRVDTSLKRRALLSGCLLVLLMSVSTADAAAAEAGEAPPEAGAALQGEGPHAEARSGIDAMTALAAALAMGVAAMATSFAQARIGTAGMGAIAENPKNLGGVIMLVAIPETVAILGFVIAYLIVS